ncbi:HesB/IscA family protein [Gimesia panareensis]|uniref:HesB/IscA family protein n=1 Tax=Gimesia panareensis TaxID=2527978 RepID=UPI00118BCEAF|nr:iron-sulfur cluster assembly accessory protein [Gimesia panareensis]QDU52327.1 Iron-sulfur cluster insertion protein ErpA [Gimesia panareensis]
MAVLITETAAREIKKVMTQQKMPETTALRVGVAGGGCSGFEYKLEFDGNVNEKTDSVREIHGVRVAVDKKSSLYLDGTEIDFHEGLDKRGFVFNNPNATKSCGCGSSFSA